MFWIVHAWFFRYQRRKNETALLDTQCLALLFLFQVLRRYLSAVCEVFVFEMFNGYALGHAYISTL